MIKLWNWMKKECFGKSWRRDYQKPKPILRFTLQSGTICMDLFTWCFQKDLTRQKSWVMLFNFRNITFSWLWLIKLTRNYFKQSMKRNETCSKFWLNMQTQSMILSKRFSTSYSKMLNLNSIKEISKTNQSFIMPLRIKTLISLIYSLKPYQNLMLRN